MKQDPEGHNRTVRVAAITLAMLLVAGCEEVPEGLSFLQPEPGEATDASSAEAPAATRLVERDVEAPEVFQVTEAGLWDGRPSLGGVWVAHPDVTDPERVIIRNSSNGKFVIGALFRRERDIPGPRLQTSSDAAAALGMLAGAPVELNVTALRRESVPDETEAEAVEFEEAETETQTETENPEETSDPIAEAGSILDESTVAAAAAATTVGTTPPVETPTDGTIETVALEALEPAPAPAPSPGPEPTSLPSALQKPYLQIGIFSVEENANGAADVLRGAGMIPTVYEQSTNGKPFWRVVVGPTRSTSERTALLRKIKDVGFSDAYAVTN